MAPHAYGKHNGDLESFGWSVLERLRDRGVMASFGLATTSVTAFEPARVDLRFVAEAACRRAKAMGGNCGVYSLGVDLHGQPSAAYYFQGTRPASLGDPSEESGSLAIADSEVQIESVVSLVADKPVADSGVPIPLDEQVTARWSPEHQRALLAPSRPQGGDRPDAGPPFDPV